MTLPPGLLDRIVERACQIQQIAAPTFHEADRAKFVFQAFESEKLDSIDQDDAGNVIARIPGSGNARPLIVSAHLDTVFPLGTDLTLTRSPNTLAGPGIGDNSLGVAALFGLLWMLREEHHTPTGDIYLVANVCEEGLGNLHGMTSVVNRFHGDPAAYIILEGMGLGVIFHRALGVQRYKIQIHTRGGHSWADYGKPSAVHEIGQLITRLAALTLPTKPRTTLNVGVVHGGTSINSLAADASLELDLRSEGQLSLQLLCQQVEEIVRNTNHDGIACVSEIIGKRPPGEISAQHPLVRQAVRALQVEGLHPQTSIGSTDANIPLSLGYPAICLGITTGKGSHTLTESLEIAPIEKGMSMLYRLIIGCESLI
jgi:acetylornithine deacetylase/succinyl-diaminopimelate desuccinylase-like protein